MSDELNQIRGELADTKQRLQILEKWQIEQRVTHAGRQERDKHMDDRFDRLEKSQDEIKGYLLKIVWVIIMGVIGAVLTFLFQSGGLGGGI